MHPFLAGLIVILVNGTPQPQYTHNGRLYIEALKGKEDAIRLHNSYPVRVAVALSVDGLNTIDAQHTSAADARKWVLAPHETVTISGWQINQRVAKMTLQERAPSAAPVPVPRSGSSSGSGSAAQESAAGA